MFGMTAFPLAGSTGIVSMRANRCAPGEHAMKTRMWLGTVVATVLIGAVVAQPPAGFNVIPAPPRVNVQDKEDVWVLDFQFKTPRVLTVDIPGRGRKTIWYLWYQVINKTGQPRTFIPDFELVTLDRNSLHHDEVLPTVQAEIAKIEDPTGFLGVKNSVTIASEPIPPSKPDANPIAVTGVAIFPDMVEKAADTTRFSIFVSGLSNGWSADKDNILRRKTLQLNFRRFADARIQDNRAFQFVSPPEWIYRSTSVPAPQIRQAPAGN
jgi:hypothetical protein